MGLVEERKRPVDYDPDRGSPGPPRVVMEVLGHSNISLIINTYDHAIPDLRREAAAKMDAILADTDPALAKQTEGRVN